MNRIHFHPNEAVILQFKFCTGFKFEVTSSLAPVDAPRNPILFFSLAMNENPLEKLLFILSIITFQQN
jgi:hypothetical protein